MVKFISLSSGSSGNAYYLESENTALLIDMGIGIRNCKKFFRDYGLNFGLIEALLVTHYHTDHIKSAGALCQQFRFPVFTSPLVHEGMERNFMMSKKIPQELKHTFIHHRSFTIGDFSITAFPVPHDTTENNGYFIACGEMRFCLITDAGSITEEMLPYIQQANYLVIEANYDAEMLCKGPYPVYLQQRISSGRGHLCNDITATTLANHLSREAQHVWLCHLSQDNNLPELAQQTIIQALTEAGFETTAKIRVDSLPRKHPSLLYHLST